MGKYTRTDFNAFLESVGIADREQQEAVVAKYGYNFKTIEEVVRICESWESVELRRRSLLAYTQYQPA